MASRLHCQTLAQRCGTPDERRETIAAARRGAEAPRRDIARARSEARQLATALGFTVIGQTRLMTAVSELARNIIQYAGEGQIDLTPTTTPPGVEIVAKDRGPGIPNLESHHGGRLPGRGWGWGSACAA